MPVRVRGLDASGERFDLTTVLDNVSAGGLRLSMERRVRPASKLFFLIRIPIRPGNLACGMLVAARGLARRVEAQPDGRCTIAVEFERHRHV